MILRKRFFCLLMAICIIAGCVGCNSSAKQPADDNVNESAAFKEFTEELFMTYISDSVLSVHTFLKDPDAAGLTDYEKGFGDLSLDNLDDTSDLVSWLNRLKGFNRDDLSAKQQRIYDMIEYNFNLDLEYSDLYLYTTTFAPITGVQVQMPLVFAEYALDSEKDIIEYLELIEQTDEYFNFLTEIEKMKIKEGLFMEDVLVEQIIEQCESFLEELEEDNFLITTFDNRIKNFDGLTQAQIDAYCQQNAEAIDKNLIPAYKKLIEDMQSFKGSAKYSGGLANKPDGKKYYEYLMKSNVGWDKSIDDINDMVDDYINKAMFYMSACMMTDKDLATNLNEYFANYTFSDATTPEDMLAELKEKIKKDFPAAPDVNYTVKNIDEALEDYCGPAMYFIPPVDDISNNSIYINPTDGTDTLYSTLAHEGYPGHMYQMTYFNNINDYNILYYLKPLGYTEGWASYCELYSYVYATHNSKALNEVMAANYFVTLMIHTKVDIGVHYYGWDKKQIKEFLSKYGFGTDEIVDNMYNAVISDPCNYPAYGVGCMAFAELRKRADETLGDRYNSVEFHRFLMDLGPTTFDILENEFQKWLDNNK